MDGFYVFLHQLFFIICRTRYISIVHYKMPKRSNPRKLSFDTLNAPERIFSFGSNYFSLYAKEHRIVSCFYLAPLMLTSSSSVQHVLFSLLLVSCFFLCLVMSPSTVTWWSSYWIYLLQDLFVFIRRSWGVDSAFSTNCSQGLLWLRDFS